MEKVQPHIEPEKTFRRGKAPRRPRKEKRDEGRGKNTRKKGTIPRFLDKEDGLSPKRKEGDRSKKKSLLPYSGKCLYGLAKKKHAAWNTNNPQKGIALRLKSSIGRKKEKAPPPDRAERNQERKNKPLSPEEGNPPPQLAEKLRRNAGKKMRGAIFSKARSRPESRAKEKGVERRRPRTRGKEVSLTQREHLAAKKRAA